MPLYEEALAAGLREPHRHRAQVQLASSLRNLDRLDEAVEVIDEDIEDNDGYPEP